eukprot:TRINITY_DN12095_c0_g1_i1.p1 TRINITY_DN12095_c0_g1~~TRINITY_DN12095_c0_g1_i1.p1  ORF type:complete len:466 (-),score=64.68 TRINITY_DN12095_c0_g1_i1:53-1450(-)
MTSSTNLLAAEEEILRTNEQGNNPTLNEEVGSIVTITDRQNLLAQTEDIPLHAPKTWRRSLTCIHLFGVLNSTVTSIVLPSLFPYVSKNDGNYVFYGLVAASFMVGTLIFTPILSFWSKKRPTMEVLAFSALLGIAGGILYGVGYNKWYILSGRFLTGAGLGSVVVGRVFITRVASVKERPSIFGSLSLAQCSGFVVGPTIAFGIGFLRSDYNIYVKGRFVMNSMSLPGYIIAFLSTLYLLVLLCTFREPPVSHRSRSPSDVTPNRYYQKYFPVSLSACFFTHFASGFVAAGFDTAIIPIVTILGWSIAKNSLLFVGTGVLITMALFVQRLLSLRIDNRGLVLIGVIFVAGSLGLLIQYTTELIVAQFSVGIVLFTIGNTIAWTSNLPIFSKLLRGNIQGPAMGWFSMTGGVGRVCGAIWAACAFQIPSHSDFLSGGNVAFVGLSGMWVLALLIYLGFFRRLAAV